MRKLGFARAAIIMAVFLLPVVWLLWTFPPYEICVRYYANEASPTMGTSGAIAYAEGLCERKIRFWKTK